MHIELEGLIGQVLGEERLRLDLIHYQMTEYVTPEARCRVMMTLRDADGRQQSVDCQGAGFVEAVFRGLVARFGEQAECLQGLRITDFAVAGHMETSRDTKGLDAEATVSVAVQAPGGAQLSFHAQGRSTLAAALRAIVAVVEGFTNAERAARWLRAAAAEARAAGRADLLSWRQAQLAALRPLTGGA